MGKQILFSENAPAPIGPYSQGVEVDGIVFFSGQIALDPKSGTIVGGSAKEQAVQVMKNIQAMLISSGLSFSNVVKSTIFLTDMADFATVNEVYGGYFQSEPPARSTIAVAGLPKNVKVEIEVICARKA